MEGVDLQKGRLRGSMVLRKFAGDCSERRVGVEAWLERLCPEENVRVRHCVSKFSRECMCHIDLMF